MPAIGLWSHDWQVRTYQRWICEIKLKVDGRVVRFPALKDRGTRQKIEGRIAKWIIAKAYREPLKPERLAWVRDLPMRATAVQTASH